MKIKMLIQDMKNLCGSWIFAVEDGWNEVKDAYVGKISWSSLTIRFQKKKTIYIYIGNNYTSLIFLKMKWTEYERKKLWFSLQSIIVGKVYKMYTKQMYFFNFLQNETKFLLQKFSFQI